MTNDPVKKKGDNMHNHDGHRSRLRQRFLKEGLDNFQGHEIIEMLLSYAIPRKDTNPLAHELINKYGSLSGLLEADPKELSKNPGIGEYSAVLLAIIPSLTRRYLKDKWGEKPVLHSTKVAGEFIKTLFAGRTYEVFYVICLDSQGRVIYPALVHEGTINQAPVYTRIIVETVLRHKAHSVILAHNHPGGSLQPSEADIESTKKIVTALNAIDIPVIDHIIIASDQYISLSSLGLL